MVVLRRPQQKAGETCGLLILACLVSCSPAPAPPESGSGAAELLPAIASVEGWIVAEGPVTYSADGLFEYLNGGAPLYLEYGFEELTHVRYQSREDEFASVTIDVYQMGAELGAFGLFSSGRPRGATPRQWAAEGYRSGTVTAAWRGNMYVHGEAGDDSPELIEMMEQLMAETSARLTGDASRPAILAALPIDGLVQRSERFVAADLLGHAFLPGGILATYEIEGREVHLFFSDLGSEAAAARALADLRAHEARRGEIAGGVPTFGAAGFRFSDPGMGSGTAVAAGWFVTGVYGDLPHDSQEDLLERLVTRLVPSATGH
jgi:hypothetical protein